MNDFLQNFKGINSLSSNFPSSCWKVQFHWGPQSFIQDSGFSLWRLLTSSFFPWILRFYNDGVFFSFTVPEISIWKLIILDRGEFSSLPFPLVLFLGSPVPRCHISWVNLPIFSLYSTLSSNSSSFEYFCRHSSKIFFLFSILLPSCSFTA